MYYIFIVNDFAIGDVAFTGRSIVDNLLAGNRWVFSYSTPNIKRIKAKDRVIVYVAGKGNRYFYANIEIVNDIVETKNIPSNNLEKALYDLFPLSCNIKKVSIWKKPVKISDIINDLKFITDKKNYGLFFRQSTKIITEEDYNTIIKKGISQN